MCGIAGILDPRLHLDHLESQGRAMMSALTHRGPDSGGLRISESGNLLLAHRRLAIQDLSQHGNQPMLSESKRYCIVFNGEIYNFLDIKTRLGRLNHKFSGHSDTEIMLAAIEEWGIRSAVEEFSGMFAFALWDRKEKILHLCRDRLGEKPLYYGWLGNTFYFASELKAIEKVADRSKLEIAPAALTEFLRYGYISAPYSIYLGIYKLPPATIVSFSTGTNLDSTSFSPWPDEADCSPKPYWSVLDAENQGIANLILDERQAVRELDNLLRRTVRRQMVADVKVGTFLSGGIDSTAVTAIAQAESSQRVKTYTIGFSEKDYDEAPYAERIAKHLGTDHLTMHVTPQDALQVVPDLASIYDEPFADSSQIPAYLVSKMAREHVTVCLSGDGGDELFAGYNRYLWTDKIWRRISAIPGPLRAMLGRLLAAPSPHLWDSLYEKFSDLNKTKQHSQKLVGLKIQKLAGFLQQTDIDNGYKYLMSYWNSPEQLLASELSTPHPVPGAPNLKSKDFVNRAMYLDQIQYLPGDNLAKIDRASMAVGLETRLPLLSHEIVEFSWRIPVAMKIRNNITKWALRQVVSSYVPEDLIQRPKMGFSVPVGQWLRGDLREWAEHLLGTLGSGRSESIKGAAIHKAWGEHLSGRCDHSHRLWTVLMFLSWANSRV